VIAIASSPSSAARATINSGGLDPRKNENAERAWSSE